MNRFYVLLPAALAAVLSAAPSAQAATFNFLAEGNLDERGATSIVLVDDGISVTATGRSLDDTATYNAYLDGGNAGLGVCQSLDGNDECDPSGDDNITIDEVLDLVFSEVVQITSITFVDGQHGTGFLGDAGAVEGVNGTTVLDFSVLFDPGNPTALIGLEGMNFEFISNSTISGIESDPRRLYISAITVERVGEVPEPGTVGLFGLGLIGLAAMKRRMKR